MSNEPFNPFKSLWMEYEAAVEIYNEKCEHGGVGEIAEARERMEAAGAALENLEKSVAKDREENLKKSLEPAIIRDIANYTKREKEKKEFSLPFHEVDREWVTIATAVTAIDKSYKDASGDLAPGEKWFVASDRVLNAAHKMLEGCIARFMKQWFQEAIDLDGLSLDEANDLSMIICEALKNDGYLSEEVFQLSPKQERDLK